MRIDIKTNPQHTTWDRMLETWRRADDTEGIDGAWLFDHFYPIFGDPEGPCLEAWTTLAALAHATDRLRVGTLVNAMPYRHPAVTANMAVAVDVISAGRLELGLGAGWNHEEADAYGISLGSSVGERMNMFDEGVEVIVRLLTQDEADFDGTHYRLAKARNEPKAIQRPHPPITIGGAGERRTLRAVARWAQHWNLTMSSVDEWRRKRDILHAHCDEVGRDPAEIMCSMMFRFDPNDPDALTAAVTEAAEAGLDAAIVNFPFPTEPAHVDIVAKATAPVR